MEPIINKVAESGLITLDLEQFMPDESLIMEFDIKPFLFKELLLREKDFRAALLEVDFSVFEGKHVAVHCSADAIIPMWAFMLIAMYLQPYALSIHEGTTQQLIYKLSIDNILNTDTSKYQDARIVVKGCGDRNASPGMYLAASSLLLPVAKSVMFGEPCSTVPVYKKKKSNTNI